MTERPRVLIVEEHPPTMAQLQTEFRMLGNSWDIVYAETGVQAAKTIRASDPFHVVVTDIAIESIDPMAFLRALAADYPATIRFALADRADDQRITRTSSLAQQFVYAPCNEHTLRVQVTRALELRQKLRACPLRETLHKINALPPLPAIYDAIMKEINSDDPSIAKVAEMIAEDVALSAKLLQIVNSAGVGLRHEVTNVTQAASLLGLQRISAMVLMVEVFKMLADTELPRGFNPDALWNHSIRVGEYARSIARSITEDARSMDAAFTSGLLHDLGVIILATSFPDRFREAIDHAIAEGKGLLEGEMELLGATHAEIGGYLLELWGLSDAIVEAIAYHDFPSHAPEEDYHGNTAPLEVSPLLPVHVANYFCEDEQRAHYGCAETTLDRDYLESIDRLGDLEEWWEICSEAQTLHRR